LTRRRKELRPLGVLLGLPGHNVRSSRPTEKSGPKLGNCDFFRKYGDRGHYRPKMLDVLGFFASCFHMVIHPISSRDLSGD
jgi:hypothetical protein